MVIVLDMTVNPVDPPRPRLRPALDDIPTYVPGRPPAASDGAATYKISSNENPFPPLPSVQRVIADMAGLVNRYPDMTNAALVDALATRFDVTPDHIAVGTGSVGVCQQIVQATAGHGDEVIYAWRSFEAYPIIVQISGAQSVRVPLTADEEHHLPAMAAAVTERTRLVFICTPNNPTSTVVRRAELDRFLDAIPGDVVVVLDEAYREFVRDPLVPDGLDIYRERPNVVVLRTFSKAYGLAGARVGFAIAHTPVAEALRKCQVPFGVSSLAQAAAIASLQAEDELLERVEHLVKERSRVWDGLRDQGWDVPSSESNFVWLRLGEATAEFAAACEANGIVVRPFHGEGCRITVAEPEANDRLLRVTAEFGPSRR
jgi:histidinol-phosphate aminotransferase